MNCNECERKVTKLNDLGQCQWCESEEAAILGRAVEIGHAKAAQVAKVAETAHRAEAAGRIAKVATDQGRQFELLGETESVPNWFAHGRSYMEPLELARLYREYLDEQRIENAFFRSTAESLLSQFKAVSKGGAY